MFAASRIKTPIENVSFILIQVATAFRWFYPPLDLRYSLYLQTSMFSLSNPDSLKFFFYFPRGVLAGNESASFGGQRASWLIRLLQREKSRVLLRFGVGVWNTGWRDHVSSQKYTLWRVCSLQVHKVGFFFFFFCLCQGKVFYRNAKWLFAGVIAPGLGIQPQNCIVRTWKPPHLNIAEVTA